MLRLHVHDQSEIAAGKSASRDRASAESTSSSVNPLWHMLATGCALRPKLKVDEGGDVLEREADRAADLVDAASTHGPSTVGADRTRDAPSVTGDETRALMEASLGHDFSRVRVHDDPRAHDAAAGLNARAFTYGSQVFFGAGQYRPGTREGNRLLAHELWHVVQQGHADRVAGDASTSTADSAATGRSSVGPAIQRQDAGATPSAEPPPGVTRDAEGRLRLDPEFAPFPSDVLAANQATPREGSVHFPFWQARLMAQSEQQKAFERALLKWARHTYSPEVYQAFEDSLLYSLGNSFGAVWDAFSRAVDEGFLFNDANYVGGSIEGGTYTVVSRIYVDINPAVQDPIRDKWDVKVIWGFKEVKVPPKVPWPAGRSSTASEEHRVPRPIPVRSTSARAM